MEQVALLLWRTQDNQVLEKLSSIEGLLRTQNSRDAKPKIFVNQLANKIALFNLFYGAIEKAMPLYTKYAQPAIEAFIEFVKDKL